jgi:1-deoxy-D-xylulose-5-phosphate reductoisomerase
MAGKIPFTGIVDTLARVISEYDAAQGDAATLEDVLAVDIWARRRARELNSEGEMTE